MKFLILCMGLLKISMIHGDVFEDRYIFLKRVFENVERSVVQNHLSFDGELHTLPGTCYGQSFFQDDLVEEVSSELTFSSKKSEPEPLDHRLSLQILEVERLFDKINP